MIQWLRSIGFSVVIFTMMFIMAVGFFPFALFSRNWAFRACHTWCAFTIWTARWMIGLDSEVRGTPPDGEALVAAKHQSFFDIILIFHALPRAKFIMKRELLWTPIVGQYGLRLGCIPVDRGKRGTAIEKMKADVAKGSAEPGQLIIYPQGTRVAPRADKPYKIGAGALYEQLNQPCVPVSVNVGLFWPRNGVLRKPGKAIVEFHDVIAPGLPVADFMAKLEEIVEAGSNALMDEAQEGHDDHRHAGRA